MRVIVRYAAWCVFRCVAVVVVVRIQRFISLIQSTYCTYLLYGSVRAACVCVCVCVLSGWSVSYVVNRCIVGIRSWLSINVCYIDSIFAQLNIELLCCFALFWLVCCVL